jgi:succinate dehydrogenase / fumarate reductase membrane anchor subunit
MSLRTPLNRVLGLGSAKDGTAHFWGQRVSGIALALLGLWFAGSMLAMPGFAHADALAFIAAPINGVFLLLLVVTIAYHSMLGVQVVIEDYVHGHSLKLISLILSRFAHVFVAVAAIYAILKIGLGA